MSGKSGPRAASARERVRLLQDTTNPKDRLGALKAPLALIPVVSQVMESFVYELGAYKYGAFNWRNKAVRYTVYLEAIDRHTKLMLSGEDLDIESGLPHTSHIRACCGIIDDARACGQLVDDRYEKDMGAQVLNAFTAQNYHSKMMAQTRTPARQLKDIAAPADGEAFLARIVEKVRALRAERAERAASNDNNGTKAKAA